MLETWLSHIKSCRYTVAATLAKERAGADEGVVDQRWPEVFKLQNPTELEKGVLGIGAKSSPGLRSPVMTVTWQGTVVQRVAKHDVKYDGYPDLHPISSNNLVVDDWDTPRSGEIYNLGL